jgi:hypothetical protein
MSLDALQMTATKLAGSILIIGLAAAVATSAHRFKGRPQKPAGNDRE